MKWKGKWEQSPNPRTQYRTKYQYQRRYRIRYSRTDLSAYEDRHGAGGGPYNPDIEQLMPIEILLFGNQGVPEKSQNWLRQRPGHPANEKG